MKYILMRFYDGGGLAAEEVVDCNDEEDLESELEAFETKCADSNLGTRIGFLTEKEFKSIQKEVRDEQNGRISKRVQ